MSKRDYLVDDVGVDGFKTDGSEAIFGRNLTFADGRKGDEMHNAYPNSYTGAYNAYLQSKKGSNAVVFARGGTAGAQTRGIFWAGDQTSSFDGFQDAVRAGISAGQSGVPYWAWDLAGFTGTFPSAELYLRSAAMATFAPVMQFHSEKASPSPSEARTPWNVQARSGDTSVVPTFRKFANVRMNLLPYIYTEAKRSADTGVPMMRAMSIDFPNDSTAASQDMQYMFGDQLLVAPITAQGATSKDVYVPAGEWYDVWYNARFTGPATKTYNAGTNTIPVYVRPGAIVPLNLNADYGGWFADVVQRLHTSGYHVTLTADHGNVAVRGIGRVADGILAEERGVRARLYTDLLLRDRTVSTIQGAIAWPGAGLPPTISAAFAPPGSAFTTEGQYLVAHGGIDLRDVMVPCISLRPTGREEHR